MGNMLPPGCEYTKPSPKAGLLPTSRRRTRKRLRDDAHPMVHNTEQYKEKTPGCRSLDPPGNGRPKGLKIFTSHTTARKSQLDHVLIQEYVPDLRRSQTNTSSGALHLLTSLAFRRRS